jgi:peptide/nickel transport system permease protein
MLPGRRVLRTLVKNPAALTGSLIILALTVVAIFAPWIATHGPLESRLTLRSEPPSGQYLFGTDILGRDVFSRVVWGSRISLTVGLLAVILSVVIGSSMGLVFGYYNGTWVDEVGSKAIELMLAFPGIIIAIIVVTILGQSLANAMIAVGMMFTPSFARVVRGATLSAREMPYVEAARALGAGAIRSIFRHILPNVIAPIVVLATMSIGRSIVAAASLSFLGLGAQPPTPEWGAMLSGARSYMQEAWWQMVAPGMMIVLTTLSINLVGDWMRDVLDPRLRGSRA